MCGNKHTGIALQCKCMMPGGVFQRLSLIKTDFGVSGSFCPVWPARKTYMLLCGYLENVEAFCSTLS